MMKGTAKKYPRAWDLAQQGSSFDLNAIESSMLFGYLVLEFFPKHGIEIERGVENWNQVTKKSEIIYYIRRFGEITLTCYTPQEAIEKGMEILEAQIKGGE